MSGTSVERGITRMGLALAAGLLLAGAVGQRITPGALTAAIAPRVTDADDGADDQATRSAGARDEADREDERLFGVLLQRKTQQVHRCVREARHRGEEPGAGEALLRLSLAGDARVIGVRVLEESLEDEALVDCLRKEATSWTSGELRRLPRTVTVRVGLDRDEAGTLRLSNRVQRFEYGLQDEVRPALGDFVFSLDAEIESGGCLADSVSEKVLRGRGRFLRCYRDFSWGNPRDGGDTLRLRVALDEAGTLRDLGTRGSHGPLAGCVSEVASPWRGEAWAEGACEVTVTLTFTTAR